MIKIRMPFKIACLGVDEGGSASLEINRFLYNTYIQFQVCM